MPKKPCLDCGALSTGSRCPEHTRAKQRRRDAFRGSSSQRGYDATYRRNRAKILESWPSCIYCGAIANTVDHVLPLADGGSNEESNLVPACQSCNSSRGAQMGNARRLGR